MEWNKPVTGDLAKDGATRYAQLSIGGNRVRLSGDRRLKGRGESPSAASSPASRRAFASASSGLCERLGDP